jgi:hypothetical protein
MTAGDGVGRKYGGGRLTSPACIGPLKEHDLAFTASSNPAVEAFRSEIERAAAAYPGFGELWREDRPDGAALASRFAVAPRVWIELVIRPQVPQIRAGIMTDDRWRNEELEEAIEETGDTMGEFVELGFDEAGLEWREPIVEHYRDQGKYFCFSTALDLSGPAQFSDRSVVERAAQMLRGYYEAFRPALERMKKNAEENK